MKGTFKKVIISFLVTAICLTSIGVLETTKVQAATKYITREEFIKLVMDELEFHVDITSSNHPYIDAALRAGIITEKTFGNEIHAYLTKSDVAVILVNADQYLHGETISDEFINIVMTERISDIDSASSARRTFIGKAYALGFITGYTNGIYSRTRSIKPWQKISVETAKKLASMLKNTSKRAKLTDDGQLIRTTNLPEFAEYYPYILASFPNDYYDWEFDYMKWYSRKTHKPLYGTSEWKNLVDYAAPKDFRKVKNGEVPLDKLDESIPIWTKKVEQYLNLVFNVDYRNLKKNLTWYQGVFETDWAYDGISKTKDRLDRYVEAAIKNKTIVESKYIGFDKSSLYMSSDLIYIRAHVRYRIISSKSMKQVSLSPIIYTNYIYPGINNVKIGEWRDCYLDIQLKGPQDNYGIRWAVIDDYLHDSRTVIK